MCEAGGDDVRNLESVRVEGVTRVAPSSVQLGVELGAGGE